MNDFGAILAQAQPHPQFDWLLPTAAVAVGYGCSESAIRTQKSRHADELLENIHWVKLPALNGLYKIFWTKRGVIRLGMFLESQRAKLFRDYAESVVLGAVEKPQQTDEPGYLIHSPRGSVAPTNKVQKQLLQNAAMESGQGLQPIKPELIYPTTRIPSPRTGTQSPAYRTDWAEDEEWDEDEQFPAAGDSVQNRTPVNQNVNVTVVQNTDLVTSVFTWLTLAMFTVLIGGTCFWFIAWVTYLAPQYQQHQEVR